MSTLNDTVEEKESGYTVVADKHGYSVRAPNGLVVKATAEKTCITPTTNLMRGIAWVKDYAAGKVAALTPLALYQMQMKKWIELQAKTGSPDSEEAKKELRALRVLWANLTPLEQDVLTAGDLVCPPTTTSLPELEKQRKEQAETRVYT